MGLTPPPLCNRKGCNLTALWQVGFDLIPRWSPAPPPAHIFTGFLVCGLCQEKVTADDFSDAIHTIATALTRGNPDAVRAEAHFYDVSAGTWLNPDKGVREPLPARAPS